MTHDPKEPGCRPQGSAMCEIGKDKPVSAACTSARRRSEGWRAVTTFYQDVQTFEFFKALGWLTEDQDDHKSIQACMQRFWDATLHKFSTGASKHVSGKRGSHGHDDD